MSIDSLTSMESPAYKPIEIDTKIKMLISSMGSNDGLHTQLYRVGKTYMVSKSLADAFVKAKKAEYVRD